MIKYLYANHHRPSIRERTGVQPGTWVRCENPADNELGVLVELGVDADILVDALDPHEVPRTEQDNGWTYFITRVPGASDTFNDFTTPLLFAMGRECIVTISRERLGNLWDPFTANAKAPTTQKTKFFILMMDAIAQGYQKNVASINRQIRAATSDVTILRSKDITYIVELERKLNDYLDALLPTNAALEKLLGGKLLRLYEDDRDVIEDLSIDLEQLITRCQSLLRTITNVRDSYQALMDTRLNETIRLLTVITLALTIPTMLAGVFGMNVKLPGDVDSSWMFWAIIGTSAVSALGFSVYFLRRR